MSVVFVKILSQHLYKGSPGSLVERKALLTERNPKPEIGHPPRYKGSKFDKRPGICGVF